jgi:hypothetical protein
MTAVLPPRPAAPATDRPPVADTHTAARLYDWVLSVQDWRVHALAQPCPDAPGGVLSTRCGLWHPMACPVTVARRGEVCTRCAAGGLGLLEVLADRTATDKGKGCPLCQ